MHTIGIDFGTSKTLVSRIDAETGKPVTIRLGQGTDYLPTSVYISDSGKMYFGDEADDRLADNTGVYLRGFKMSLGSSIPVYVHYTDEGESTAISAREMVYHYLRFIREKTQELAFMGEKVSTATITRPVNFSAAQCEELRLAAIDAGFTEVTFTTEPEAAGLAFCRLNAANAFRNRALIVDWGGGTLDFALVTRDEDSISTHSELTDGDTTMGGERFDDYLWSYAEDFLKRKNIIGIKHTTALPQIRKCKEKLSTAEETQLYLSSSSGTCPPIPLTRALFNKLIEADIEKAIVKVQQLLERIPEDKKPEMLLLVGGSSRIINPVTRLAGSGSQSAMDRFMGSTPYGQKSPLAITGGSIGFSFRYYLNDMVGSDSVKMLSLNGVYPSPENIQNGTYPVIAQFYAIYRADNENENIQNLIDWLLSDEGQQIIEQCGYVRIGQ